MPTILEMLKIKNPGPVHGVSLLAPLTERAGFPAIAQTKGLGHSIMSKNMKYIFHHTKKLEELYDLSSDAAEKNNIFKGNPRIARALTEKYLTEIKRLPLVHPSRTPKLIKI